MRTGAEEIEHNNFLLEMGEGLVSNEYNLGEDIIEIPQECIEQGDLITSIFGERIVLDEATIEVLAKKAILTPKNEHVHKLNEEILKRCEGEAVKYFSNDSVTDDGEGSAEDYPVEYVNTFTPSGFPLHQLELKVGAIIMLLRNLNKK